MIISSLVTYLATDRRRALARGDALPDRTYGSALFADISGFTALTESLAQALGTARGAEELTRQLNQVYDALITHVHNYRGSVIGFAGDAMTCFFEEKYEGGSRKYEDSYFLLPTSSFRAVTCALAMQDAMRAFPHLALKIGIATGPARRFIVGDPQIQLIDTLAGKTIETMARAAELAQQGEIVLAPTTFQDLTGFAKPVRSISDFTVIGELATPIEPTPWDELPDDALHEEQLRPWILPALYERLRAGQEQFSLELRAATALFVQFQDIDYDNDERASEKLDASIRHAQHIVNRYDGNIIQLTIGDKGSFFYAVLGAPIAHDDDAARAIHAALDLIFNLQSPISTTHIGIAQGQMRVGAYGGTARRTYGAIGDATNLAARLMQAAPHGEIRCDYNVYRTASKRIAFETLPPIRVKGKAGLIRVYQPVSGQRLALSAVEGSAVSDQQSAVNGQRSAIIGRRAEIVQIEQALDEVQRGATRVLIIEGEAGIGKSRLVEELKRLVRERGLTGLLGNGQSVEQQTPYRAWRDVFNSYFELDSAKDRETARKSVEAVAMQLIPEHVQRLPVLNDVLGLDIPENELTQSLGANLRVQNVTLVLTALLRAWTNERPLVLVLEDAHWLDDLSWRLALDIARALTLANAPLLFVIVNRPLDEHSVGQKIFAELRALPQTQLLALSALAPDEIVALIAHRLNVTPDALPTPLVELVQTRANGNPFFAEELVFNLRDHHLITYHASRLTPHESRLTLSPNFEQAAHTLPDTLHGLILSRIDRLPPERQFVLKVAAVIGRAFAFAPLHHVVAKYVTMIAESLKAHLTALTQADFTFLESLEPELTYLFKHIITQEAAYQTLLFAQRRELHRAVAEWYENRSQGSEVRGQLLYADPYTCLLYTS
ncbi:MAG: AAA family ATPase, partial [Anaerolineae bacterium]|nr:AAA family ATPase [Anaerolineae bacterium]